MTKVTMVRVYLTESNGYKDLFKHLHDKSRVRGVTVFRGISGFGKSGRLHSSTLLDVALDLPVVVEFFDTPERIDAILTEISHMVKPGHVVTWSAAINEEE